MKTPPDIVFRPLETADVSSVVDAHIEAFPKFFLTSLGRGFLRLFYRAFLNEPTGLAWVAVGAGGQVCGAVVGTTAPRGFFRRLLAKDGLKFGLASLAALLRNPAIAPRIMRAVFYRGADAGIQGRALLSSLLVVPSHQGLGVGAGLMGSWLRDLGTRGCPGAYLITDTHDNDQTIGFYLKRGWKLHSQATTPEGRGVSTYVYDF